jgi:hypothetical protein
VNATFIDGSSVLEELVPGSVTTYRPLNVDFLPEQPEDGLQRAALVGEVRLHRPRRDELHRRIRAHVRRPDERSRSTTPATRWDASLSYRVNRRFTLYVEGRNLTDEVTSWYATTRNRPEEYFVHRRHLHRRHQVPLLS